MKPNEEKIYNALEPVFGLNLSVKTNDFDGIFTVEIDCIDEGEECAAIEKAEAALKEIGAEDLKHGENRCRVWIVGSI